MRSTNGDVNKRGSMVLFRFCGKASRSHATIYIFVFRGLGVLGAKTTRDQSKKLVKIKASRTTLKLLLGHPPMHIHCPHQGLEETLSEGGEESSSQCAAEYNRSKGDKSRHSSVCAFCTS